MVAVLVGGSLATCASIQAQDMALGPEPDSTSVTGSISDTLLFKIEGFPYRRGAILDSTNPVEQYHLDLSDILSFVPGSFGFDFGNVGWPDQWTYLGISPSSIALSVDRINLRDAFSDRPLYDAAQVDLLDSIELTPSSIGGHMRVDTRVRSFDVNHPFTELKYKTGRGGLQSISGTHVQHRNWHLLGAPTVAQFVFRYASYTWGGDYPNSDSDMSQLYARIGFTAARWRVRLSNSYTLRKRGAHRGVKPKPGRGFDSVYERFDASVVDPNATQRMQRNDIGLTVEHQWDAGVKPLSVFASFSTYYWRYSNVDRIEALSHDYALGVEQEIPKVIDKHAISVRFVMEASDFRNTGLFEGRGSGPRARLNLTVDDNFSFGRTAGRASIGWRQVDAWAYPTLSGRLARSIGEVGLALEGEVGGRAPSRLEEVGGVGIRAFSGELQVVGTGGLRAVVNLPDFKLPVSLTAFYTTTSNPIEIVRIADAEYQIVQSDGTMSWLGVTGSIHWNAKAPRGTYATFSPTIQSPNAGTDELMLIALKNSLPSLYLSARFGYRNQFFLGDLDLDVYLFGKYWSRTQSRIYDPVSGLLVLPQPGTATTFGQSGTVDFRIDAGIREATIFLSLDNILADFLYPGTLVVPVYPLLPKAFRFGLLWPITD